MSDEIEEIKRRIDIVDLISSYLTLKKAGTSYKALCPFHQEKVPSFYVSPERQIFKCFGCQKAGSIFDFLMEIEHLEFPEALKILADKAGVKLKRFEKKEYKEEKDQKSKLYEINKLTALFFHKILTEKPKAKFVRDYLRKRQISQKSIEEFKLGYAPDSYDLLYNFLKARGYLELDINKAGLTIASEKKSGEFYDRFRDRLIFPIFDVIGNVVAFSGRAMRETKAGKYINSPNTPIYSKSKILYGLDKTKKAIVEKKEVIVVEGQTDLISLYQRGFRNVVASGGTALTPFQLDILSRYTLNLTFAFDQDKAGEEATKRAIDLAHQSGFEVKIILLETDQDPDLCLREDPKAWHLAYSEKRNIMDYYFEMAQKDRPKTLTPSDKREIAKELLPIIKNIGDKILQAHFIGKLGEILKVPEKYLFEALVKIKIKTPKLKAKEELKVKKPNIEEQLLGLILAFPKFQTDFFKRIDPEHFKDKELKDLAKKAKEYYNKSAIFNLTTFKRKNPQYSTKINLITLFYREIKDFDLLQKEYEEYIFRLLFEKNKKIQENYEEKIKEAEKFDDRDKVKKLIKEFQKEIIGR